MWSIIAHGGAGVIRDSLETRHKAGLLRAIAAGTRILEGGGASLDAVCATVRVLEDDPTYNAGLGGALDERGMVALDASVMRGSDLAYGAIGAVCGVLRAVDLARAVMEDGRHCILVGPNALDFARERGIPRVDPASLVTDSARKEWARRRAEKVGVSAGPADWEPADDDREPLGLGHDRHEGDTVGAVALDQNGVISAATSTGGTTGRRAGRIGDSPIAGAGIYARDDLGGISATGHGETMLRTCLAYQVLTSLQGAGARRAEAAAIIRTELDLATARTGGKGGIIAVLPGGVTAYARNTLHMGVAWASDGVAPSADF